MLDAGPFTDIGSFEIMIILSESLLGHSVTNQGTLHHHVTKIVQIWLKSVPK